MEVVAARRARVAWRLPARPAGNVVRARATRFRDSSTPPAAAPDVGLRVRVRVRRGGIPRAGRRRTFIPPPLCLFIIGFSARRHQPSRRLAAIWRIHRSGRAAERACGGLVPSTTAPIVPGQQQSAEPPIRRPTWAPHGLSSVILLPPRRGGASCCISNNLA
jgi:hypothetical protein